ncbi:hypothetical protein [Actinotalea sp. C106]|uniref:hypothetical protein n=1 Tax=Actinotalea sp. C106 TaxID=2908644 RepID=UPI0020291B1A|nr:hypothetical protein [Actinotalea sp. C106]
MSTEDRVLVDVAVRATPDAVWAALRDPEQVHRWFGWDDDGLAAEIQQIFVDEPTEDPAARTLVWPDGDRIALEPISDLSTRVLISRKDGTTDGDMVGAYDAVDEGWITFAHQLQFALERHPRAERRTIAALGVDLGSEEDALLARLGLRPLGDAPVGSAYAVERADGSRFTGEIAFQTDLQIGLTVAEEEHALLVVARTPPSAAPPHGVAMFVLNTYGLDDARIAQVEQRWTAWWTPTTVEDDPAV